MDSQRPANRDLERWMLEKARIAKNIYDAEAMLLTAKALYPSFEIEHAAFTIHCVHQNVSGAAAAVQQMYVKFNTEPAFWAQVSRLVQAVRSDDATVDQATTFRRMVFNGLLPALQQTLLLELFEKQPDQQEKCQLVLLLIRLFPDSSASFATMLLQLLEKYEKPFVDRDHPDFFNFFTTLLVRDVVSLLLQSSSSSLSESQGVELLLRAVGYYLAKLVSQDAQNGEEPLEGSSEESEDGWGSMLRYFAWLAHRCGWKTASTFTSFSCARDPSFWTGVRHLPSGGQEAFCLSLLSSLFAAFHLCRHLPSVVVVVSPPVACFESDHCFPSFAYSGDQLTAFLAHLEDGEFKAFLRMCTEALAVLTDSDRSRAKMYELLKAPQFAKLRRIIAGCCLLLGRSEGAKTENAVEDNMSEDEAHPLLDDLQQAGSHMAASNFAAAGRSLLSHLEAAKDFSFSKVLKLPAHLDWQFVLLDNESRMDYCIHSLVCCLAKMISQSPKAPVDDIAGHCVVLMQVHWPIWSSLLEWLKCLWRKRGKFVYANFFLYVNETDVLEEIAYVAHTEPTVEFQLGTVDKPGAKKVATSRSQSKPVTAETVKRQIEQHMGRQRPALADSLRTFFSEQRDSIERCFEVG